MGTDGLPSSHTTPKKAHATSDTQHGFRIPSQPHLGETPHTRKSTPQVSGDEFAMNATRDGVAKDLGPAVPEVEYEFFERHLLPPLPSSIDINNVLARLEADQIIVDGRWQQFPIDPWKNAVGDASNERRTENKVFAGLVPLVDEIVQRSGANTAKTLTFKCLPDYTPPCCFEKKKGRPDGFFVFDEVENSPDEPYWCDIITPAEFKLRDRRPDLQDDIRKICWNMHQVMREDPRRRFVFGFTIENTQMRIWMLNRSDVVVSQPFNFITDHKKFLHFFLSQTYASPQQLGIDTTMEVIQGPSSGELIYNISVHDAKSPNSEPCIFRTDGLINDDGAQSPLGRGTRVWRVKRLVDGEPDDSAPGRVLKDSWVDEDRDREGEILEQILDTPGLDDLVQQALAELFLTQVVSGDVVIDGKPDSTRDFLDGVTDIPAERIFPLTVPSDHKPSHRDDQDAPLIVPATDSERAKILKYSKKRHYRIVFVQECEPLSEQTSLHKVFKCLWDITTSLNLLHLLGWVHRDISTGNILCVRETGKWVLSDVEYAKKLDNHDSHGIRTGTANFMAVEVDQGTYLFRASTPKSPPPPPPQRLEDIIKQIATSLGSKPPFQEHGEHQTLQRANPPSPTTRETFRYNPAHDLESLFWIALYFVINKDAQPAALSGRSTSLGNTPTSNAPDHGSHPSPEALSSHYKLNPKQLAFAKKVFYDRGERVVVLLSEDRLEQYFKERPQLFPEIGTHLCELRAHLHGNYITIEKPGYQIDKSVCQNTDLYTAFKACFEKIVNETEDVIVSPLLPDLDTDGVLPSASRSRSTTALLVKFNDTMKRKAAYEAHRTSAPPVPKKWKPSDASESNVFE